jgi:hypothetical protein
MCMISLQGELHVGGKNFSIPEQAAILLQQAFEAMKGSSGQNKNEADGTQLNKGKTVSDPEPALQQSKGIVTADVPESSKQAKIRGSSGKVPYCYRCKTKGHAIEVCHAPMYCDICALQDHVRPRCPKLWAVKLPAMPCGTCGFAVEGLRFFHIPHELSQKQRNESRSTLIRVLDGSLSIHNVVSELKRLIPGPWA